MFKVDLTDSKMRNHRGEDWTDMRIKGNSIVQDAKITREGLSGHLKALMPLSPPGRFTILQSISGDKGRRTMRTG